ncbi:MAG: ferredoxin [Cognaticolwellia sp.]|jgi:ferredoxin
MRAAVVWFAGCGRRVIAPHQQELCVADPTNKWEDNVVENVTIDDKKVSFYVDKECILCSVCSDAAPNNFRMSDDEDHDIVYKQPSDEEELEQCYEAMENCPVEAIGDDG